MAGAYPKCTDCIPDPCLQPGYVDVIYFDTRVRHYAGHNETLWVGEEVNAYTDLAKDNEGVGRISLGQHTLDDFTGKDDCDLIAYFWDNDAEQLFAVERSRATGVDGDELWRVGTGEIHPGFPCKSNNGYVVFILVFSIIPGGASVNSTLTWRDVHTGSAVHSYHNAPGFWRWVTPLNEDEGIGVNAGGTNFEAPLEGSALNIDELLPADPPYATATNFLMGPGANFAGTIETEEGEDPVTIVIDRGVWRHLPGSLVADAYSEILDENRYGFVSQWCDKLYIVRNSPGSGVDRWPYTGASVFLGTEAVYTGNRAAYVVEDTFPDGGDETEDPGECPCDGGDGGTDCDACDCEAAEFEIEVISEVDTENPGCWLVTVNCIDAPCGEMTNFVWTIPTGDCETVTYGPGYGWQDGTCGEEFQVCGEYLVIRITDDCGCKATICLLLEERTACDCCNNVEPDQVSITIASITNQAEVTCPDCPDANGTYTDAVEATGAPDGCSWVLTGGACHLLTEDICEGTSNLLLYYTATLSITNCGSGAITITSTIGVQLFISSDENCSGSVVGGCTYQKVVVVDEVDQPANCLSLINGTHENTESCSAGSACILPDEITVTWS